MPIDPNIKQVKIHPAIGLSRLSTNEAYYVFDPLDPIQPEYKAGDTIKRQAVQFRLFAYGDSNVGLYELTPEKLAEMGLRAIWSADLANSKIEMQTQNPSDRFVSRGETSGGTLNLVGNLSTFSQSAIPMGELTETGLFIPPVAGIFKRTPATPINEYSMYDQNVSDNSSDGSIGVRLESSDKQPVSVSVMPAWISVGPQNFAPAWNDIGGSSLLGYLEQLLSTPNTPPVNPVNAQARELDRNTIERGTAVFAPGIEFSGPFRANQFYPTAVTQDPDEIRFMPSRGAGPGLTPGGATDTLCSPWQYDFRACTCGYWPNQRPDVAYKDDGQGALANWRRKIAAEDGVNPPGGNISTNSEFIEHVYELGIIEKTPGDPDKRAETERHNNITDPTS